MKQILHILGKDARHFWAEILISLALVGAFAWINPKTWPGENTLYASAGGDFMGTAFLVFMLSLLVPVSWWLLIARVIHAEALVGDRQFWLTRPYEWKKLLAAKALFLLLFLYLPLLAAQCWLLVSAGFHPLPLVPGLLFNLLLITVLLILPLWAITSVTATFARLTVTLLAGLVCFIGYVAISLHSFDSAWIPDNGYLSIALSLCVCGTVVVLQYASRRVWLSRMLLISLPVLLCLGGLAVPPSTVIDHDYARARSGEGPAVQLTLLRNPPHPSTAYMHRTKQVQVNIPLQVTGVAEGYALIPDQVRVTVDAANGRHWTSSWQGDFNQYYLPGVGTSDVGVLLDRAFFDQVNSTPVTLHFKFAITQVQAGEVRTIPLQTQDFAVPGFGMCSPQEEWPSHGLLGITCRSALRQSRLTYIRVLWPDHPCSARQAGPNTGVPGDVWVGTLDNRPAEFGISPVRNPQISLSNGRKGEGEDAEPRHLCPGTPVTFTQYNMVRRFQYDTTIPNFHFPSYQPDGGSFSGSMGIDITTGH